MGTSSVSVVLALVLAAQPADKDVAAAAEAFGTAQRAELARDWGKAADFYELADSLAPSAAALRSAAKNRFAAEEYALAATLAGELQRRYGDDGPSRKLAKRILEETSGTLAQIELRCDRPCVVSANGRAAGDERALTHAFFTDPGKVELAAAFEDGTSTEALVEGTAGETTSLTLVKPAAPRPTAVLPSANDPVGSSSRRKRLSPVYFVAGAVVTLASASALVWSGFDVLAQNDDYESDPTQERLDTGQRAELRTNVLIATTATFAVATTVIGVFTDWGRRSSRRERARWTGQGVEIRF